MGWGVGWGGEGHPKDARQVWAQGEGWDCLGVGLCAPRGCARQGGVVEQGSRQARWRWRARRTRLLRKSGGCGGGGVPSVLQAQVGPVQRAGQGPRR